MGLGIVIITTHVRGGRVSPGQSKVSLGGNQSKNTTEELLSDVASFGVEAAMRKLVLAHAALQVAQSIGLDYHAATEELYHYMRHHDESEKDLEGLISLLLGRAKK